MTRAKTNHPGYQFELVDDVIHLLRIYRNNFCVAEHCVDRLMDSIGTVRFILNNEQLSGLKERMARATADLLIDQLEEDKTAFEEEYDSLETSMNPDMELMAK